MKASTLEQLKEAFEEARKLARVEQTPEARTLAKKAWAALDAASPKPKMFGHGSRAGQRQQAERRSLRTTYDNRWKK